MAALSEESLVGQLVEKKEAMMALGSDLPLAQVLGLMLEEGTALE
jgi:hypothetical protein